MIGTIASVRDWVADQLREIRYATPVAVLDRAADVVEARRRLPECEWHQLEGRACLRDAAWRVRLHDCDDGTHLYLLCHEHTAEVRNDWARWSDTTGAIRGAVCSSCGRPARTFSEAFQTVGGRL